MPSHKSQKNSANSTYFGGIYGVCGAHILLVMVVYLPSLIEVGKEVPQILQILPEYAKFAAFLPQTPHAEFAKFAERVFMNNVRAGGRVHYAVFTLSKCRISPCLCTHLFNTNQKEVIWCPGRKIVYLVELTFPHKDNIDPALEKKNHRYEELVRECEEAGWFAAHFSVEGRCGGFAGRKVGKVV